MDDSDFPRTPDRPVMLLATRVRYQRSIETSIGARGPDFLGGSATHSALPIYCSAIYGHSFNSKTLDIQSAILFYCIFNKISHELLFFLF